MAFCYCRNGRLSATAAFRMCQHGFQAGVLQGGIRSLQR